MAKLGISLPDELYKKLEETAKAKKKPVSGLIAEALQAYFSKDGGTQTPSQGKQPPEPGPSTPPDSGSQVPSLSKIREAVQALENRVESDSRNLKSYIDDLYKQNADLQKEMSDLQGQVGSQSPQGPGYPSPGPGWPAPGPGWPTPFPWPQGNAPDNSGSGTIPPPPPPPGDTTADGEPWTLRKKKSHVANGNGTISFYPNDPLALDLSLEEIPFVGAASDLPPFRIQGTLPPPETYPAGSLEFQELQLYTTLTKTLESYRPAFQKMPSWYGGMVLAAHPRAGRDLNAFYAREKRGLFFYSDVDASRQKMVYACESVDVVAHETGHAILDSLRPQLYDAPFPEAGAFHESFGDMTAILTGLSDPKVREAVLAATVGNLRVPNPVAYLAEEFGQAVYNNDGPYYAMSPDYLRSAINSFHYADPSTLSDGVPDAKLSSEEHSFSRVFTGAFYDLLVMVYEKLRGEKQDLDALEKARVLLAKLLVGALRVAPLTYSYYQSVARGMMQADQSLNGGKFGDHIFKIFLKRKIFPGGLHDIWKGAREKAGSRGKAGAGEGVFFHGVGKVRDAVAKKFSLPLDFSFGDLAGISGEPFGKISQRPSDKLPSGFKKFLSRLREHFGFPEKSPFDFVGSWQDENGIMLEMASSESIELTEPDFGILRGAMIDVPGNLVARLSPSGVLMAAQASHPDKEMIRKVKVFLKDIVEKKKVELVASLKEVDPRWLFQRKKPWVVMRDAQGVRRLRRAYYA